jgi:putative SOS response-associated peptidase YedK
MCGRFTNRYTWRELHALYRLSDQTFPQSNFEPRYNIAPTQNSWVVREREGKRELISMRFGLVPSWSKDDTRAASMINARAETVAEKAAYRAAFKSRPCLVVADGFYEWKQIGPKEKQPYFITLKNRAPFAFGGLWESWNPKDATPNGGPLESFTIITTEPNELCAKLHDRMPLILTPPDWPKWLATAEDRAHLLTSAPSSLMECWPVGKAVGNVRNQGPKLIEPSGAET